MKSISSLAAAVVIGGLAPLSAPPAFAQPAGGWGGHMWNGGGWMFFGPLTWIIVIAAIVVLVIYFSRASGGRGLTGGGPDKTPLDILDERFARGEIDEKEYEQRKKVLKG